MGNAKLQGRLDELLPPPTHARVLAGPLRPGAYTGIPDARHDIADFMCLMLQALMLTEPTATCSGAGTP